MKDLVIIAPYFGKLPDHFQLWLNSCSKNLSVDWLLLIDDKTQYVYPGNVVCHYTTLNDLKAQFQQKFPFEISLETIKKLGDYKPLYGYMFEDEIKDYVAWGYCDVGDVIYGNFNTFLSSKVLANNDHIFIWGHLSVFRNDHEINRRFMLPGPSEITYEHVFRSERFYNFEETAPMSINAIYQHNNLPICRMDGVFADLSALSYGFQLDIPSDVLTEKGRRSKKSEIVFQCVDGRVLGHEVDKNDNVVSTEYLYVHFKRRKMLISDDVVYDNYVITPKGFIASPAKITSAFVKEYGKGKWPDPLWLEGKKRAFRERFINA